MCYYGVYPPTPLTPTSHTMTDDQTKTCPRCGEVKPRSEFSRDRSKRDGLQSTCRVCRRNYRAENKEARAEYQRKWVAENKEARAESNRKYYAKNKEARAEYDRKRREERGDDPAYITRRRCVIRSVEVLKRRGLKRDRSTLEYLGLESWDAMVEHVESLFAPGMSWENRDEWELDHVEPFANVVTHDDFVRVAHHSNIQVLWKRENRSKYTRTDWTPDELDR